MSKLVLNETKRSPAQLPSFDSISLRDVNLSKVLRCFATEGDGAYPPSVATVMFTVACVLLVLPTLNQICTRKFVRNVLRLVFIAALFSLLVIVLLVTTYIQANDLFCFFATKRMIDLLDERWEPILGVFLMAVLALVNLTCARMLREAFLKGENYFTRAQRTRRNGFRFSWFQQQTRTPKCQREPVKCN